MQTSHPASLYGLCSSCPRLGGGVCLCWQPWEARFRKLSMITELENYRSLGSHVRGGNGCQVKMYPWTFVFLFLPRVWCLEEGQSWSLQSESPGRGLGLLGLRAVLMAMLCLEAPQLGLINLGNRKGCAENDWICFSWFYMNCIPKITWKLPT